MLRREISKSMDDTMIKKTSHPKNDLNNNVSKDAEAYGPSLAENDTDYKYTIKWTNVLIFIYLHYAAIYGFTFEKKASSRIFGWVIGFLSAWGTTVGAHRLWTHRTFKANLKMRVMLMLMQSMAAQNDMIEWVRDHRVHHKYTDTNADPHNSKRGFFFCHIGWLMCNKHPDVKKYGSRVDMSDVESDPVLQWQRKYYTPLALFFNFAMPTLIVWGVLGESFALAWNGNIMRYLIGLHLVWCINSVAHMFGDRPFDKNISPTDSYWMGFFGFGEGWHNYHHCFPWDYKTSELPTHIFNFSTAFIDLFAWIGWATDLKTVPQNMIDSRATRTGDGSHEIAVNNQVTSNDVAASRDLNHFWGFGDKEMTGEDMKNICILSRHN